LGVKLSTQPRKGKQMALRDAPEGLSKAQLMEWIEIEISSNLYDAIDLAALHDKLVATRDAPEQPAPEEPTAE
jgi:hypothetical protein